MLPSVTDATDDLAGFAALMAGAGQDAKGEPDPAPYGYTKDEATGEMRPKKAPGRPRKSPPLDDLKARKEADAASSPEPPAGDRAPAAPKGRARRRGGKREPKPAPPVPQSLRYEGAIAKGVNRIYRKIGKLVSVFDPDVGGALIMITRADDEDDTTVGDAWEALARQNPRVKAALLRALAGGALSELLAIHLPVLGAILMKESIRNRIPFARLATAFISDDGEPGESPAAGTPFEGLQPEDLAQMHAMAQAMAEQVMNRDLAQRHAMAEQVMNRGGSGVPERGNPGA